MSAPAARVSVVMPVFNVEPFVEQALRSVLSQSYPDFEVVVVDDGSTDRTADLVTQWGDPRIRLIRQSRAGIVGALNRGLDEAEGTYIARMDGDDEMAAGRLSAQVAYLDGHPRVAACGTDYELFGAMTGRVRTPRRAADCRARLLFGCPMSHPAVMFRRSVLDGHQLRYLEEYAGAEDYRLFSELANYGDMVNLPIIGLRYRRHPGQISTAGRVRQRELHLRICQANLRAAGVDNVTDGNLAAWLWPAEQEGTSSIRYLRCVPGLLATGFRGASWAGVGTAVWLIRENLSTLRHR